MQDIIHLLPDSIANQIAAGEVVQRPASVVKEMLENSIDAGAKEIKLIIREAGKTLIQIIDDGKGMSVTDARMSFERHATSKIRTAEDLFRIMTMGFRGEALASIAAVAQVEMKTRRVEDELGTLLQIEASEVKKQEPIQTKAGTSISVKNLFYNVPARRNFLKSNPVELRHITDEFQRVALANAQVSMSLIHNDMEIYNVEGGKLSRRIVQLFGKNYQQQLIPCQEETPHVKITGYIGKPEFSKKTRGEQYFFVNNRFIKSSYLNHAVTTAYQGLLKEDYFPFYVLFIEMDPVHVDINVHPTKTEVKFDDDRMLYGVVSAAIRQALGSFNVTPSLDFNTDVNFEHFMTQNTSFDRPKESASDKQYAQFKNIDRDKDKAKNWESLYDFAKREDIISPEQLQKESEGLPESPTMTFSSAANHMEEKVVDQGKTFPLHDKYLIRQVKSGMVVIDQKAAFERILFERYKQKMDTQGGASQSSLFPQQVALNPSDYALVMEIRSEIQRLGFEFEELGQQMIVIQGVPAELSGCNEKEVFEELLEQFKFNKRELGVSSNNENLCRALAKRTATIKCKNLAEPEAERLIDQLFACSQPNYTPDGVSTFVIINLEQVKSWFSS
ncbi:DNA mismatch repair endonuclease MutL [Marinoscillum sp. MHG1-6]|uniref:DNA mismatch repair endonuclease MutL n=1 Tax=Marinoscillum sp. MHG1-6 TaxID=2959627 RepID=UPI0021580AFC|nr:DNA mismatch repair endonuclease MutL [Marinoscillum sp. MHG1-6]